MKAEAVIFTAVQQPFTFFGISPRLFGFVVVGDAIVGSVMIITGFFVPLVGNYSTIVILGGAAVGVAISLKISRSDPHIDRLLTLPPSFWRLKQERVLIAGGASVALTAKRKGKR